MKEGEIPACLEIFGLKHTLLSARGRLGGFDGPMPGEIYIKVPGRAPAVHILRWFDGGILGPDFRGSSEG